MSTFRVPVTRVRAVETITDATALELAVVGDFRCVVAKGRYAQGDLVAYIPEASLVPEWVMRALGVWDHAAGHGKLDGAGRDRVKARRFLGCMSQGLVYPVVVGAGGPAIDLAPGLGRIPVSEGDCVAAALGIVKHVPAIPPHMLGEIADLFGHVPKYDIENRKAYPDVLVEGEPVAFTEKVHGTFAVWGVVPGLGHPEMFFGGDAYVSSKGFAANGMVFKDVPSNDLNLYVATLRGMQAQVEAVRAAIAGPGSPVHGQPVHVMGEVYGPGVQKRFDYGLRERRFRGFEVYVGQAGHGRFMGVAEKRSFLAAIGVEAVDFLYVGPYSAEVLALHANGPSQTGRGAHMREGVVITPLEERRDHGLGRVILKEVSEAWLDLMGKHKDATDYS